LHLVGSNCNNVSGAWKRWRGVLGLYSDGAKAQSLDMYTRERHSKACDGMIIELNKARAYIQENLKDE
jgi:hypothetical protein